MNLLSLIFSWNIEGKWGNLLRVAMGMITVRDEIVVQLVRSWDNNEIADLYRAGGWWKEEYDPETLGALIQGSFLFAVAVDKKTAKAIGMGRVISDGVSDGYIQDLVVLPNYRKSGIGREMVSVLVNRCIQSGIRWIALIAEPSTEIFYLPLCFKPMKGHIPMLFGGEGQC
jgi:ribosomal protein S18 acetylase RimI-like enzyme